MLEKIDLVPHDPAASGRGWPSAWFGPR